MAVLTFDRSRALDEFEPGLIRASLGGAGAVVCLPCNEQGRDFVVGDIHGMFRALETALDEIGFDPCADRLFSVGDLMDRGPNSALADRWIREFSWFHAIRGNHDQMLLDALIGPELLRPGAEDLWIRFNGGEWWLETEEPLRRSLVDAVSSLPLAVEILCDRGRVGIVHADVPPDRDWQGFLQALRLGIREDVAYALWSRTRLGSFLHGACRPDALAVVGIDLVVSGHVPLSAAVHASNRWWIDTGAAYSGRLAAPKFTLLQVHPGEPAPHAFHCGRTRS